jgi:hypothetical protein
VLRPIAENTFAERQNAEGLLAENLFAKNGKFSQFAEKVICRNSCLPKNIYLPESKYSGKPQAVFFI